ncbi:hypothetical protein MAM1_0017c01552 [Mucor ambiguus]|uniref:Tc1-like transposase DDE domain-containing protein n=1 Tax=Mucor ambiguus TaxID=91626 RepID=A0A0C9MG68_9FUNG|nr:hypothetical protein MAM1_0017c01552 [Mucor ambiguus]
MKDLKQRDRMLLMSSPQPKKALSKGTITGHYMLFLQNAMNPMDQYPDMKGFYIAMNNSPIHIADDIEQIITKIAYRRTCLPPYSQELNPIEKLWSIMTPYIKKSQFIRKEGLTTRVTEASDGVRTTTILNMSRHSVNMFDKCLQMEPTI